MTTVNVLILAIVFLQAGDGLCQNLAGSGGQVIGTIANFVQSLMSNSSQIQNVMNILKDPDNFMTKMTDSGQTLEVLARLRNLTNGIDADCTGHMMVFMQALYRQEQWALRMVDAIGKPPSGLMNYKLLWIGDWDECISTKAMVNKNVSQTTSSSSPFSGKFCPVSFPLHVPGISDQDVSLTIGTCFPDSCSSSDVQSVIKMLISFLPENLTKSILEPSVTCQENNLDLDGRAIIVIAVCAIFVAVMTLATLYDVVYINWIATRTPAISTAHSHGIEEKSVTTPQDTFVVHADVHVPVDVDSRDKGSLAKPSSSAVVENDLPKPRTGLVEGVLLSFSVFTNGTKLLSTHQPKGALTAVNGIRFISMSWVIVGHAFGMIEFPQTDNVITYADSLARRWEFTPIMNGTFSVDTFFVLSGLLVSYLSLREMKKVKGVRGFKWVMFYFHRFWRLTPPYMLLFMLYVSLDKYLGEGPLWYQDGFERKSCEKYWWTNLLYINNLVKLEDGDHCFGWTWYLANDMQFYIISPLLLIPLFYSPILGGLACLATLLGSAISSGLISIHFQLPPSQVIEREKAGDFMWNYYIKPWCRIGPYVVGMFAGYMLYRSELKTKINRYINLLLWVLAITLGCLIIYGLHAPGYTNPLTVKQSALYNATARSVWGACVAWVIYACANGYGGPINHILSWSAFVPLGRLTYFAYLTHPILMIVYTFSVRSTVSAYDYSEIYLILGHLSISYGAAFVLSLAFEAPMMGLEKVLLGRSKTN